MSIVIELSNGKEHELEKEENYEELLKKIYSCQKEKIFFDCDVKGLKKIIINPDHIVSIKEEYPKYSSTPRISGVPFKK